MRIWLAYITCSTNALDLCATFRQTLNLSHYFVLILLLMQQAMSVRKEFITIKKVFRNLVTA